MDFIRNNRVCGKSGEKWITLTAIAPCPSCVLQSIYDQLAEETKTAFDEKIFEHKPLEAVQIARIAIDITLDEGVNLY